MTSAVPLASVCWRSDENDFDEGETDVYMQEKESREITMGTDLQFLKLSVCRDDGEGDEGVP